MIHKKFTELNTTLNAIKALNRPNSHIYFFKRLRDSNDIEYREIYVNLCVRFNTPDLIRYLYKCDIELFLNVIRAFNVEAEEVRKKYLIEFIKKPKAFQGLYSFAKTEKGRKSAYNREQYNKRRNLRKG